MDDPLSLLREFIKTKKPVYFENNKILFGEIRFDKDTPVKFKNDELTLGQVWFFLKHSDKKYAEYMNECRKHKFDKVSISLQSDLKSYLIPSDVQFKPSLFERKSSSASESASGDQAEKRKREDDDETADSSSKRVKRDHEQSSAEDAYSGMEGGEYGIGDEGRGINGGIGAGGAGALVDAPLDEKQQHAKQLFSEFLNKLVTFSKSNNKDLESLGEEIKVDDLTPFVEYDNNNLKKLKRRELSSKKTFALHGRIGLANTKANFSSITTTILPKIKVMEVERKKQEEVEKRQRERIDKEANYDAANIQIHTQVRDKRYNEESIWKSSVGAEFDEFQIDPMGSNIWSNSNSSNSQMSQSQSAEPPASEEARLAQQQMEARKIAQQQAERKLQQQQHQKKKRPPIIIVPPGLSSMLTLYNVKDFLQNNEFVTTEVKKQKDPRKPDYVVLKRNISRNQHEEYFVIDNPTKLAKEDWSRVIAVFTTGQPWQFRGWFSEDPTTVLNKIKGFHVKYQDDPLNENIAKWPVTVLQISKNQTKRHTDQTVVRQFWEKATAK